MVLILVVGELGQQTLLCLPRDHCNPQTLEKADTTIVVVEAVVPVVMVLRVNKVDHLVVQEYVQLDIKLVALLKVVLLMEQLLMLLVDV